MAMTCAITAAGVISAAGDTPEALFATLIAARPLFGAGAASPGAAPRAPIAGFDPSRYLERRGLRHLSRPSQLACSAASRIARGLDGVAPGAVGVVLGSAWAGLDTIVRFERAARVDGPRFVDPGLFAETVANVPAGQVSICFGWSAVNTTVACGTASGLEALAVALELLEEERAGVVVAGGADELGDHLLRALGAAGRMAASAESLPFAEDAAGPIGGEGACLVALEREERAARRGAPVLARVRAAGCHQLEPHAGVEPRRRLLERWLEDAGIAAREVDLVVLSGNGDPARDRLEADLLRSVFGEGRPAAVAPKAVLGETWGAAGPLGVVVACEAMRRATIPGRPAGLRPFAGAPALAADTRAAAVRHAVVLDCPADERLAAVVLSSGERS